MGRSWKPISGNWHKLAQKNTPRHTIFRNSWYLNVFESWQYTHYNNISLFCLAHTHHTPANKSCNIITKAFQPPNQNQSPTKSLFFGISLTGRQTERSVSVPLIRQAWVIKKEIRRSVWERPSGPLLICSQLIVLAFYCFLLGWQIREHPAKRSQPKSALILEHLWDIAQVGLMAKGSSRKCIDITIEYRLKERIWEGLPGIIFLYYRMSNYIQSTAKATETEA